MNTPHLPSPLFQFPKEHIRSDKGSRTGLPFARHIDTGHYEQ